MSTPAVVVTGRHCTDGEKTKLTLRGNRFKLFFQKGEEEIPALLGQAGPENAALKLGAEEFEIGFAAGGNQSSCRSSNSSIY